MNWQPGSDSSGQGRGADNWLQMYDEPERVMSIEQLRREVEEGAYVISAQDIADAILRFFSRSGD